jgi:hypothetical protein
MRIYSEVYVGYTMECLLHGGLHTRTLHSLAYEMPHLFTYLSEIPKHTQYIIKNTRVETDA